MIEPGLLAAFAAAVTLLMLVPGPNVALIVAGSLAHGPRHGLATVAGTLAAQALSLTLVAAGLTTLLQQAGAWFGWLRWAGAAYLIWLGIRHWRAPVHPEAVPRPGKAQFARGFLVSLLNPKTLLFYGAFLPQFIMLDRPVGPQVALLSAVFLAIAAIVDSGWALAAGRVRPLLARRGRLAGRVGGGILAGAGTALALLRPR